MRSTRAETTTLTCRCCRPRHGNGNPGRTAELWPAALATGGPRLDALTWAGSLVRHLHVHIGVARLDCLYRQVC